MKSWKYRAPVPMAMLAAAVLARADAPASDWRYYLKDQGGTRHVSLDQVNRVGDGLHL